MPELTVRKSGNSLAVVIPKPLAEQLGLRAGDHVHAELAQAPSLREFDGILRGRATADQMSAEADEGEGDG